MKRQSGFTLVEIAIVLVIIGLLLGGVLKGQEIITNAKVKNLENSVDGVAAAIYSYQDRYRATPGDDNRIERFGLLAAQKGDGDGVIEGAFDEGTDNTVETRKFWLHLRNAGLVTGATDPSNTEAFTQPLNAFGGITGVATSSTSNTVKGTIRGIYVGFNNIPNEIAIVLESRADDNEVGAGTIQSSEANYTTDGTLHELYFAI